MQSFLIAAASVSTLVLGGPIIEPQYIAAVEIKQPEESSIPRKVFGHFLCQRRQLYVIPELPEEEDTDERGGCESQEEAQSLLKSKTGESFRMARRSLLYDLASVGRSNVVPPQFDRGVSGATFRV